jgi:hypothetical protein
MDASIVAIRLADGSDVFAEVEESGATFGAASLIGDQAGEIDFSRALARVRNAADELLETIRSVAVQPDSYEITFGIKLNAQAGAIIAKASAEANFTVKMSWIRPKEK